MADEYRLERLSDQHWSALAKLFRLVFGFRAPAAYFQKKYDTQYTGASQVCALALVGDEAVAFHGCLPARFSFLEKKYLAAQTCDYLTLPEHRGKGLNKQLGNLSYELMRQAGIGFLFTFNSDVTFAVHRGLGWHDVESMHRYHFATGVPPISKIARRLRALDPAYQSWVRRAFRPFALSEKGLANPLADEGWLCAEYTPEYFAYKSFTPNHVLDIQGVPVWVKVDGLLQVGAVGSCPAEKIPAVVSELRRLGRKVGAGEVLFQISPHTGLDTALQGMRAALPSWRMGFFDLGSGVPAEKVKLNFAELDTY
jgi:hypothetical protein